MPGGCGPPGPRPRKEANDGSSSEWVADASAACWLPGSLGGRVGYPEGAAGELGGHRGAPGGLVPLTTGVQPPGMGRRGDRPATDWNSATGKMHLTLKTGANTQCHVMCPRLQFKTLSVVALLGVSVGIWGHPAGVTKFTWMPRRQAPYPAPPRPHPQETPARRLVGAGGRRAPRSSRSSWGRGTSAFL